MRIEEGQMAMTGPRKWRARGGKISVTGILTGLFLCFVLTSSSWGGVPVDLQKKIGKAVDKGKKYLYDRLPLRGTYKDARLAHHARAYPQGVLALHLYALYKVGVSPYDRNMETCFRRLARMKHRRTYSVGAFLLCLYARSFAIAKKKLAARGRTVLRKPLRFRLVGWERKLAGRAARWLQKNVGRSSRGKLMSWGYPGRPDFSNTQYAVLGLWAAEKMGVNTSYHLWKGALDTYIICQSKPETRSTKIHWPVTPPGKGAKTVIPSKSYTKGGGWRYQVYPARKTTERGRRRRGLYYGRSTLSMTLAGACSVILAKGKIKYSRRKLDKVIGTALCESAFHLEKQTSHFTAMNPYNAYTLERLGAFSNLDTIGKCEWYPTFAGPIVDSQQSDGSWKHSYGPIVSTAMYLLFLTRATLSFVNPKRVITGSGRYSFPNSPQSPQVQPKPKRVITGSGVSRPKVAEKKAEKKAAKKTPALPKVAKKEPAPQAPGRPSAAKKTKVTAEKTAPQPVAKDTPPAKKGASVVVERELTPGEKLSQLIHKIMEAKKVRPHQRKQAADLVAKLDRDDQLSQLSFLTLLLEGKGEGKRRLGRELLVEITGCDLGDKRETWILWRRDWKELGHLGTRTKAARRVAANPRYSGPILAKGLEVLREGRDKVAVGDLIDTLDQRPGKDHLKVLMALEALTGKEVPSHLGNARQWTAYYRRWWKKHNRTILLQEMIRIQAKKLAGPRKETRHRAAKLLLAVGEKALVELDKVVQSKEEPAASLAQELIEKIRRSRSEK